MTQILHALLAMMCEMAPYILLGFLIAGLLHAFVPTSAFTRHLSGRGLKSVVKAAAVGIPLPLCSCGVLPTAIALRRGGASKAASTSFLIATPQTGVDSIAATASLLGPAFAVVRPIAALATSLFGGLAVGATERDEKAAASSNPAQSSCEVTGKKSFGAKCIDALRYGFVDLVGSIGGWLIVGLVIAALITVFVPADALTFMGERPLLAMIAVLIIAIPMYVCATGSIPIALSLMLKGLSPGTALVLLMAGPAANFASFALISREMGRRAAIVYIASIAAGAIAFGLVIDYLLPARWFAPAMAVDHSACHPAELGIFPMACAALLAILLIYSLVITRFANHKHLTSTDMTQNYRIEGMNCPHCQASVTKAIAGVSGVEHVEVSLAGKSATVEGTASAEDILAAVRAAGFDALAL